MSVLVWFAIILFILMVVIGGQKGARSFIALFFNFVILIISILFMADPNIDPIIVTLIATTILSCVNLFYINEINIKTKTAFISTMATIIALLLFIIFMTESAMIQGFSEEQIEEIKGFSVYLGVDFVKIAASVIIMSTIGAITDVAISISSPMREIYRHNPDLSRRSLYQSGVSIGKDILGTSTNTLFFAFFGGYMALLIWFMDLNYSFGEIVNSKIFSAEMVTILAAGIGVALVIPITSWVTAYVLIKSGVKEEVEE
ncbi:putative membrane protein [Alkalibacillus filiformis]|uniref:Membrane protein n=1 Tax=Alkalibacillus filiformis TaxID=200990 RepID=A0ABU0DV00_9BACI|nr:YibE/F family protein [Alkalibacillus filiformis]MDQ0352287.1 putative membrane protein [Alkalibacillus filiformis]